MAQLPNGGLLVMNRYRPAVGSVPEVLFNPYVITGSSFGTATSASLTTTELFCAGHVPLHDGTILVTGGHNMNNQYGRVDQWIFDPSDNSWVQQSDMGYARWYPTTVFLPNRRVMTFSGEVTPGVNANRPTMWLGNVMASDPADIVYTLPAGMAHDLDLYYPHIFIDPYDGNLFVCGKGIGESADNYPYYGNDKLNLATLEWTDDYLPLTSYTTQNVRGNYPSAVMINGRIVRTGGSKQSNTSVSDCSKLTQWIDLKGTRTWNVGPDMVEARKNHTLVALPDGRVAAFGGNKTGEVGDANNCRAPEVWDPFNPTEAWVKWSDTPTGSFAELERPYHSTALLVPDGRVIIAGGEPESWNWTTTYGFIQRQAQLFSPPYGGTDSWQSGRPTITNTPGPLRYGDTFSLDVDTSGSRQVSKLTLISLGATTHAFNQRQTVVFLTTTSELPQNEGTLTVNAPAATKDAPPGYYMLFAVDSAGVPSVAKIVLLKDFDYTVPQTVSLTSGTFSTTPSFAEAVLGENVYLGSHISSTSSTPTVEFTVDHGAPSGLFGTRNLRLCIQLKTSTHPVTATAYLYNWTNSTYDEVDHQSQLVSETEQDRVYTSSNYTGSQNPYVRSTDGLIRWKFKLTKSTTFDAYIDLLELGVRS